MKPLFERRTDVVQPQIDLRDVVMEALEKAGVRGQFAFSVELEVPIVTVIGGKDVLQYGVECHAFQPLAPKPRCCDCGQPAEPLAHAAKKDSGEVFPCFCCEACRGQCRPAA